MSRYGHTNVDVLEAARTFLPSRADDRSDVGAAVSTQDFRALYDQFFPLVWRWAGRLGVPPQALEDVVQEVFLVVHGRLDEFEGRSTLKTWLFSVTLGVVRNFRRRRSTASIAGGAIEVETMPGLAPHPEAIAAQTETMEILQRILDGLDDEKREVFVLAELEEMTLQEIGTLLGISSNTATSRLRLAREAVKAAWERERARDRWRLR